MLCLTPVTAAPKVRNLECEALVAAGSDLWSVLRAARLVTSKPLLRTPKYDSVTAG